MRRALVRLYPAGWRARYGDEFEAVLDERPLGPFDVADILLGALDARLRLRWVGANTKQERAMSLRIGGIAAIFGAVCLAAGGLLNYRFVPVDDMVLSILLLAGLSALVVALTGLSAFQARVHPGLIWSAFAMTGLGALAAIVGWLGSTNIGGDTFWGIWFLGAMAVLIGSALFAVATYQTATLSRGAAVLVGIGSLLPFGNLAIADPTALTYVSVICLLSGWFGLGVRAIQLDRPAADARPA